MSRGLSRKVSQFSENDICVIHKTVLAYIWTPGMHIFNIENCDFFLETLSIYSYEFCSQCHINHIIGTRTMLILVNPSQHAYMLVGLRLSHSSLLKKSYKVSFDLKYADVKSSL